MRKKFESQICSNCIVLDNYVWGHEKNPNHKFSLSLLSDSLELSSSDSLSLST